MSLYDYLNQVNIIFPWQKVNLLSSHLPTIWILVWIISVWNLKYKTIGCREIHSSVLKKSNCVKANYLGGPALISHLKIPFVSRLVFLRLSLSNKKSIIKFKCHNIQSTDSGLGPVSTLEFCIQKETKPKFYRFSPLFQKIQKRDSFFLFNHLVGVEESATVTPGRTKIVTGGDSGQKIYNDWLIIFWHHSEEGNEDLKPLWTMCINSLLFVLCVSSLGIFPWK